jgi:hypothetical protein
MGTYYGLGVVNNFTTQSFRQVNPQQLEAAVNERLDLGLFDVTSQEDGHLQGTLKANLFQDNIEDFFAKLDAIAKANTIRSCNDYFQDFGTNIEEYPCEHCRLKIYDAEETTIELHMKMVLLLIEGKVSVEEFDLEPALLNWLFRHSSFDNPLAGAIISDIVG